MEKVAERKNNEKKRKRTKKRRMLLPEAVSLKGLMYNMNNSEGTEETHQIPQSDMWAFGERI
jgi:hypothetical protein